MAVRLEDDLAVNSGSTTGAGCSEGEMEFEDVFPNNVSDSDRGLIGAG